MYCSLPGCTVYGTLQARILEWIAIPFSRESSQPRDGTRVSCIADRFLTIWVTRKLQAIITLLIFIIFNKIAIDSCLSFAIFMYLLWINFQTCRDMNSLLPVFWKTVFKAFFLPSLHYTPLFFLLHFSAFLMGRTPVFFPWDIPTGPPVSSYATLL